MLTRTLIQKTVARKVTKNHPKRCSYGTKMVVYKHYSCHMLLKLYKYIMKKTTKTAIITVLTKNETTDLSTTNAEEFIKQTSQKYIVLGSFLIDYKIGGNLNLPLIEEYREEFTAEEFIAFIRMLTTLRGSLNTVSYASNGKPMKREALQEFLNMKDYSFKRFISKLKKLNFIATRKIIDRSQHNGIRKQVTMRHILVNPYLMKNKTKYYDNYLILHHFKSLNKDKY